MREVEKGGYSVFTHHLLPYLSYVTTYSRTRTSQLSNRLIQHACPNGGRCADLQIWGGWKRSNSV